MYSKSDFWIGYNDIDNEGDWVWSDRTTSSYTNWDDKSPNNGGVSCAIVTRTGKWHDEPCQSQYSFICKKPSKSRKKFRKKFSFIALLYSNERYGNNDLLILAFR